MAYAVLAHISNSTPGTGALGVVLAVGPLLLAAFALGWRSGYRLWSLLGSALAALLVYHYWPALGRHFPWLYLLQQASVYAVLALFFGRSLAPGRVPLCTDWATRLHGPLPPAVARYTRTVTAVWTLFFALIMLTLIGLFLLTDLQLWSAFANFATFPLIVALFIAEYAIRQRVLPGMRHGGILAGVRAFLDSGRSPVAVRRG